MGLNTTVLRALAARWQERGLRILDGEPMSRHTTLRIGGPADLFVPIAGGEVLAAAVADCRTAGVPFMLMGRGSNLLAVDAGIRGVVFAAGGEKPVCSGEEKDTLLLDAGQLDERAAGTGTIFTGNNVDGGIADYYGAYMLRETMKQRLYYDTHIIAPEDSLFTMDYWQSINSVNYEEMPVSNLTAATQPEPQDPDEGGCGGTSAAGFAMIAAILAAALGTGFALRRAAKKK